MGLLALAAGARTLREVEELSDDVDVAVRRWCGLTRRLSDTALRNLLVRLEPDALRVVLQRSVQLALRRKSVVHDRLPCGVVSIDGKTTPTPIAREPYAQRQEGKTLRGLVRTLTSCLISSSAFPCLDAMPIPASTNETGQFREAFDALLAAYPSLFDVVMGDAAFATVAGASHVAAAGKGYVFQLKENTPTLYADAVHRLDLPDIQATVGTAEKEDGRLIARRVWIVDIDPKALEWKGWEHATRILRVDRLAVDATGKVIEVLGSRYFVTNLKKGRFNNAQWLRVLRDRWAVENQNHGTWDNAFGEDDHPWIDEPQGLVNVAILRRVAYNVLTLIRSVTLRSEDRRQTPWRRLLTCLRDALITATQATLDSFRSRPPATQ